LKAGSNSFFSGSVASRLLVNGTVTRGDLRRINRSLKRNRAQRISEIITASARYGTEPVGEAYFAVCHTDLESDWADVPGWTPVEKYSNSDKALPGEIGKVENMRVITSDLFAPWMAAATSVSGSQTTYLSGGSAQAGYPDVYPILIFGQDSYAIVPLKGMNAVKINVINPTPSIADVCGQRGAVSWKMYDGGLILNDFWMARYEVACTAKP
jgi:N4-gp56 family major capsid protein